MTWLRRLLDQIARGSRAKEVLTGYQPYCAPFPGDPTSLTFEQAEANLEYLLSHRDERLAQLGRILSPHGIDVQEGLRTKDMHGFLDRVYAWIVRVFPGVYESSLADWNVSLHSNRTGKAIVLSLTMDLAILLGELVVRNRPSFQWGLDLDPENGRDQMQTYKRAVVEVPKGGAVRAPIIIDVEALIIEQYRKVPLPIFGTANELSVPIMNAISGAYEQYWLEHQEHAASSEVASATAERKGNSE